MPFVACVLAAVFLVQGSDGKVLGVVILGSVLFFVGVLSYFSLWSQDQRRREAQALVDWGAGRGLALSQKEPDAQSCAVFARATFETVLRGPVVAGRTGAVCHLAIALRRRAPLMMLIPFWGAAQQGDVDLWTAAQFAVKPGEGQRLGRLVLSRRELHDLPALAALRDRATALRHVELSRPSCTTSTSSRWPTTPTTSPCAASSRRPSWSTWWSGPGSRW